MDDVEVKLAEVHDQENVPAIEGQLAGMSQQAVDQVERHLDERPTLSTDDIQREIDHAKAAEDAMIEAQHLRHDQEERISSGDLNGAHELADAREYQLHVADDQGGFVDRPLVQAQQDVAALDWAAHEQFTAADHAASAASYAAVGDTDHATQYAEHADAHAESASSYAHTASHTEDSSADAGTQVDTTQTEG